MDFLKEFSEKPKKLFQFFFWNMLFGYLPIGLLSAFLSLFGKTPFMLNKEPIYGIFGFLLSLILTTPLFGFGIALMCWVFFSIGNFIIRIITRSK